MEHILGTVVNGSLTNGFLMRVSSQACIEKIKVGKFVCIQGQYYTFFSLVTDLKLDVSNQDIIIFPPDSSDTLLKRALGQNDIYATAELKPLVCLTNENKKEVKPVKTIPSHFAPVLSATQDDISLIFGKKEDSSNRYFHLGKPLDMDAELCIDLEKFSERSNGIFGKTGTGKTFLTRLVLSGLISKKKAVTLIFDTHNEYGRQARQEGGNQAFVKGLKTLFENKVAIFSLDSEFARKRGSNPDYSLSLDYSSITVEDITSLSSELNLHNTACEAASLLYGRYKKDWLSTLLNAEDLKALAQEVGAHGESIAALYRKLKKIDRLGFIKPKSNDDVIKKMLECINSGRSIIIEFGKYTSTFCYLLLANVITRRLRKEYIEKTEKFLKSQQKELEPQKLMIVIEEAHKFLNPQAARQTIFGTIAREMRKYYVSLLVIDQRPSGIDPEILSQIATKIIAQLNDEKDINAVLTGTAHAQQLKVVLSGLESKKQVLLLGHALPVPIVIESRNYDEVFYREVSPEESRSTKDIANSIW